MANGTAAALVDMEQFSGREYPDVLIEILIALLDSAKAKIRWKQAASDLRMSITVSKMRSELNTLLTDPAKTRMLVYRERNTKKSLSGTGVAGLAGGPGGVTGVARASRQSQERQEHYSDFEVLKIERLLQIVPRVSGTLRSLAARSHGGMALAFVDDFGYVALPDQPDVLGYLSRVCKGTGFWLKIGGVESRLRTFRPGDPPQGMELGHDVDLLQLDVTLASFATAKGFLERVLDGVLKDMAVRTSDLLTPTARDRLVLACGGAVARDYITITESALSEALDRMNKDGALDAGDEVKITAEDVHRSVRKRIGEKESESLKLDAGSEAQALTARWQDVCSFVQQSSENEVFVLVEQSQLESTDWGRQIQQLENLRLLHRIRDTVPKTPSWRGRRVIVYMIDLGQVANQRMRTGIPEFWKGEAEFDRLRRAEWVYTPGWRPRGGAVHQRTTNPAPQGSEPLF
ncbi:hypothetical protein [Demequina lutea]|uniref:Uncharacterized protein n=1 Tax=Demequina lutea TaxID=431489 RepID=A0A7Y9ZAP2_9MICO|nr:hypothetical protein [Demequina lutea]NYI41706.1 hypothetical protein [Demequina lutea]